MGGWVFYPGNVDKWVGGLIEWDGSGWSKVKRCKLAYKGVYSG